MLDAVKLRELSERPAWRPVVQTVVVVSLYICLCVIVSTSQSLIAIVFCWWLMGFMLSGALGAAHDCAHRTMFKDDRLNSIMGNFWGVMAALNFSLYRGYHLEHHRYAGVDGDTEPAGEFQGIWQYFWYMPTLHYFFQFWHMTYRVLFGEFPHYIRREKDKKDVIVSNNIFILWVCSMIALTFIYPYQLMMAYWIPLLVYFPMVFFSGLLEHYGCELGSDPRTNTRSTESNALFRFLFWNGNYHAEHHVYPRVPSCNLGKLHKEIGNQFVYVEKSYMLFHMKLIGSLIKRKRNAHNQ